MRSRDVIPPLTEAAVLRRLQSEVEQCGNIARAADFLGITRQCLLMTLRGRRHVGPKLMKRLGLRRTRYVFYRYEDLPHDQKVQPRQSA